MNGQTTTDEIRDYDVVVVGGGAAGLAGAVMLARSRRSVLVIDAGEPRNAPAEGVHGFLSREGISPGDLLAAGRAEVRGYGGDVLDGRVVGAARNGRGFTVTLDDGRRVGSRRLLVATGLVDELPEIPGLRERWGRDVVHCPYCHGWEIRDRRIGILATGPTAVHHALLFRQLSPDVTLFTHTEPRPEGEEARRLAAAGVTIVEGEVGSLEIAGDRLTEVRLRGNQHHGGHVVPVDALAVAPRFAARADLLAGLGLPTEPHPLGPALGESVPADPTGRTAVPGVWVAGNVTNLMAQVIGAAAAGAQAGAMINADLVEEDAERAVSADAARAGSR